MKKIIKKSYYKNNNNEEIWSEYNQQGQIVYRKEKLDNGIENEYFFEYDNNGNLTSYKDSTLESYSEYDNNGNKIYYKDSSGVEWEKQFDNNNNEIYHSDIENSTFNNDIVMPAISKPTHLKTYTRKYNKKGHILSHKENDGYEEVYEYNKDGNMTYFKNTNNREFWFNYDKRGNMMKMII